MALSKKRATTKALVRFVQYARANGYKVSEMPPYDPVTPGGHSEKSWHYDKDGQFGQAADLNWGASGASAEERARLALLVPVAQSYGLGIIFGLYGTNGPAAQHRGHMHVDVGSYSNLGRGGFVPARGDTLVVDMQLVLHQPAKRRDNLLGQSTRTDLYLVREASRYGGTDFPHGVRPTQRVVGAPQTGRWDATSRAAHDKTVARLQRLWGVPVTSTWDDKTEAAYRAVVRKYGR